MQTLHVHVEELKFFCIHASAELLDTMLNERWSGALNWIHLAVPPLFAKLINICPSLKF